MQFFNVLALASIAAALPLELTARQEFRATAISEYEFTNSQDCAKVIFVWARGTTEQGNMGSIVGQPFGNELRKGYGNDLQIQGIDYAAAIVPNLLPGGTDQVSKQLMDTMLTNVHNRCPNSVLLVGGYSQGAAIVHRSLEAIDDAIKNQIAAVVTFGDTQRDVDHGRIPNFPQEKFLLICSSGLLPDTVCDGNLAGAVLLPHLRYAEDAPKAAQFMFAKAKPYLGQ